MKSFHILIYLILRFSSFICIDESNSNDDDDDDREGKIIGGFPAKENQYPYAVSIQKCGSHWCGGTLIYPQWILSAAHCFCDFNCKSVLRQPYWAIINSIDLNNYTGTKYKIVEVHVHQNFSFDRAKNKDLNDIALLKLQEVLDVSENSTYRTAALPTNKTYQLKFATIAAYGWNAVNVTIDPVTKKKKEKGSSDNKLRFANFKLENHWLCHSKQICGRILSANVKPYKGICGGDSGSGLIFSEVDTENNTVGSVSTVGGIVNTSPKGCTEENLPSQYAKVFSHMDFIESAIHNTTPLMQYTVFNETEEETFCS